MPHTPGGKHAAWVDRHPPLSHRRTSGTHFRVARAILSGVPLYMRLSKPNTFLEYHIVINSRGGGRPGKNGPHTNYMVKCLVFEISNRTNQTKPTKQAKADKPNNADKAGKPYEPDKADKGIQTRRFQQTMCYPAPVATSCANCCKTRRTC